MCFLCLFGSVGQSNVCVQCVFRSVLSGFRAFLLVKYVGSVRFCLCNVWVPCVFVSARCGFSAFLVV